MLLIGIENQNAKDLDNFFRLTFFSFRGHWPNEFSGISEVIKEYLFIDSLFFTTRINYECW